MRKPRDIPESAAALTLSTLVFAVALSLLVILGDLLGGILVSLGS